MNCGDSFLRVEICEVNSVSPPVVGCERRKNVVKPGGRNSYDTSECQLVLEMLSAISKLKVELASLRKQKY